MNINEYVGQKACTSMDLHDAILEQDLGQIEYLLERYSWDMKRNNVQLGILDMKEIATEYENRLTYRMVM